MTQIMVIGQGIKNELFDWMKLTWLACCGRRCACCGRTRSCGVEEMYCGGKRR